MQDSMHSDTVWERLHGRSEVAHRLRELRKRLHAAKEEQQLKGARSASRRSRPTRSSGQNASLSSTPVRSRERSPVRSASVDRSRANDGTSADIDHSNASPVATREGVETQVSSTSASPVGSVVMDGGAVSSSRYRLDGVTGHESDVFQRLFASPLRPVNLFKRGKGGTESGSSSRPAGAKRRSRSVDPEKLYTRLYSDQSKKVARERAKKELEAQQQ